MIFRKIKNNEINIAYSIIQERYNYLINKSIFQYPYPYPKIEMYLENQQKHNNYGLFNKNEICGIVTLLLNNKIDWSIDNFKEEFIWISYLYSNPKYNGNNIGYSILDEIKKVAKLKNINYLLLDCYKDGNFLENYYIKFGFEKIDEKLFKYPKRQFTASLMKYNINKDII